MKQKILNKLGLLEKSKFTAFVQNAVELYDYILKDNTETITNYKTALLENQKKQRVLASRIGGLTRYKNALERKNKELSKQLEEALSNRYIVRKLPSGRPPKSQTMKYRSSSKQSKIIKYVKNDN